MEDCALLSRMRDEAQTSFCDSTDNLSISGLELDETIFGLQLISDEADVGKVLQGYSDLELRDIEHSEDNLPQTRYGHEELETNWKDDFKNITADASHPLGLGFTGRSRHFRLLVICALVTMSIVIVLPITLNLVLKHNVSVFPCSLILCKCMPIPADQVKQ